MSLRRQLAKVAALFHPAENPDEEIRLHIQLEEQENREAGMSLQEAHFAALRKFGNVTQTREVSRAMWTWRFTEQLFQDVRFGIRQMRRNKAFTATAVMTLALGMGATTAIFSLANALIFKPLPVPDPQQLVSVTHGQSSDHESNASYPLFASLAKGNHTGIQLFGLSSSNAQLVSGSLRQKVDIELVSDNFYNALKVRPAEGRLLNEGSSANSAVLSYRLWHRSFQDDTNVVGKKILLDGVPFIITGVLPQSFLGVTPGQTNDLAITFAGFQVLNPKDALLTCRNCLWLDVMGRLNPGISLSQAEAALNVAWQAARRETVPDDLPTRYRSDYFAERLYLERAGNGQESILRFRFAKPLYLLLGMSSLILLIACSNVANLLLARSQARQQELAVRFSTGASRFRIAQQFLTESLVLAFAGLLVSTVVYQTMIKGLLSFMQRSGEEASLDTTPDMRMVAFAGAIVLLTVLLFGFLPALRASRVDLRGSLAESATTLTRNFRPSLFILAGQMAISITLLTGALLLSRSLHELKTFDAGFRRDHLLIAAPDLTQAIPAVVDQARYYPKIIARLNDLPGVKSTSASMMVPGSGQIEMHDYIGDGYIPRSKEDTVCALNFVTPHYFQTMGINLLAGRDFSEADARPGAPSVAVVNEVAARQFWGNQNPIGKRMHEPDKQDRVTVIGMVRNSRYATLRREIPKTVYRMLPSPAISGNLRVAVWTAPLPESMIASVRQAFEKENSLLPVVIRTFSEVIDRRLLYERLLSLIAISFAALALLMAAVGIYGVAAYSASRRKLEMGIRVSVGASKPQIIALILGEHLWTVLAGVVIGLISALQLTGFLRNWLFGLPNFDVPSFVGAAASLSIVSAIAVMIPAVKASRAEPSRLLRSE